MNELMEKQIQNLQESHFHILYWTALAEKKNTRYNITNVFDDLKYAGATRTKQSAVSYVESLVILCFVVLKNECNRKNIYITKHGARALEQLLASNNFNIKKSLFLEESK